MERIFFVKDGREIRVENAENSTGGECKGYTFEESAPLQVSEALAEYAASKRQGEYTLEDYLALPDDQRVELIDGVFYDMASPNYIHQAFGDSLQAVFNDYIRKNHGSCRAFTSVDVQLDCDDRTVVQPDVLIICDYSKLQKGHVYGAPDLVVEVLSPSTSKKDECVII
ncbi:MAG: Uma2 family endonuclease [Clostridiales bacterium]|nr:Uma2 family endonuclease [Clostridiales bacterium]